MSQQAFIQLASSKFKFGLFLFTQLPSAWFCGVRLRSINAQQAVASVPYKWLSQNPFKSTYFACQAMAAELSTGVLAQMHIYKRNPKVSMLVTGLQANYIKKATERVYFTCQAGEQMLAAIEAAIQTGEPQTITVTTIGTNKQGELISDFQLTWSFKAKG